MLRSVRNTTYVPDELWAKFIVGEIDHFVFAAEQSHAVYTDDHSESFDSTVTQEMIDADREKWLTDFLGDPRVKIIARVQQTVTLRNHHPVMTGWTA